MAAFVYRCPATGMNVQGWIADPPTGGGAHTYESVTCLACAQVHLVNPANSRVLGADSEAEP
jgi:hypothetical protein